MGIIQEREAVPVEEVIDNILVINDTADSPADIVKLNYRMCRCLYKRYKHMKYDLEAKKKAQPFIMYDEICYSTKRGALAELLHLCVIGDYADTQIVLIQFVGSVVKYILVEYGNHNYRKSVQCLRNWNIAPNERQRHSLQFTLLVEKNNDHYDNIRFVEEVNLLVHDPPIAHGM